MSTTESPRRTVNLTVRTVESLKAHPPKAGRDEYYDEGLTGFGLRISRTAHASWFIFYRRGGHTPRRYTFGSYPALGVADARAIAREALHKVANGGDPAGDKKAARLAETMTELCADYLEGHAKVRKKSWKKDEQIIEADIKPGIGTMKVADVRPRDIKRLLRRIVDRGAPIQANRVHEVLSSMFGFAIEDEIIDTNPCASLSKPSKENRRDRVLSEPEIWTFWRNLAATKMTEGSRRGLKLILVTAQRPGEVMAIEPGKDLDLTRARWIIPAEKSKNKRRHLIPLSALAVELIREQLADVGEDAAFLFPGSSDDQPQTEASLCRAVSRSLVPDPEIDGDLGKLGVVKFTPHDLRRTAATHMAAPPINASRFLQDRILNHAEVGVGSTYDIFGYVDDKTRALEGWAQHLRVLLASEGKPSNIVEFRVA